MLIGVGLHPGRWRLLRPGTARGTVVDRKPAPRPPGHEVEADVGRDLVQPRPERPAVIEPWQSAPDPQQGILERVVGIVHRPEQPVAVRMQFGPVKLDQPAEGVTLAAAGALDQRPLIGDGADRGDSHARSLDARGPGPKERGSGWGR